MTFSLIGTQLWLLGAAAVAGVVVGLGVVLAASALVRVPWPELVAERSRKEREASLLPSPIAAGFATAVTLVAVAAVVARHIDLEQPTTGASISGLGAGLAVTLALLLTFVTGALLAARPPQRTLRFEWTTIDVGVRVLIGTVLLSMAVATIGLYAVTADLNRPVVAGFASVVYGSSVAITLVGNVASLHRATLSVRGAGCVLGAGAAAATIALAAVSGVMEMGAPVHAWQAALIIAVGGALSTALVMCVGLVLLRGRRTADLTLGSADMGLLQDTLSAWFVVSLFFVAPAWIDAWIDAGSLQTPAVVWLPVAALLLSGAAVVIWGLGNSFGHLTLEARRTPDVLMENTARTLINDERVFLLDRHLVAQAFVVGSALVAGLALATIEAFT